MRLYAVITPPPHVLADIAAAVERAAAAAPEVPWLARDLWHLRLAYLGNLDLKQSMAVRETLQQIGSYSPPLALRVSGLDRALDDLWSLAKAIPSMVQKHGLFLDRRSFRSEVTVAREMHGPFDARAATSALATYQGVPWTAQAMQVVRWRPGSGGTEDAWEEVEVSPHRDRSRPRTPPTPTASATARPARPPIQLWRRSQVVLPRLCR